MKKKQNKLKIIIMVFAILLVISLAITAIINLFHVEPDLSDKIAIIPVNGFITTAESTPLFFDSTIASSGKIVSYIKTANEDSSIKAILVEVNSPGGTVVASEEIMNAIKKSNKPTVALIRETGASGAYWIASGSDIIVANPMSITGSIGVRGSYLEFSGLMEKYGVSYEELKSGDYKEAGSPYKKLTDEERRLLQGKIDLIYDYFVNSVAQNRNLSLEETKKISNGMYYLGIEAKDLGLVDYLGDKDFAVNLTKNLIGVKEVKLVTYKEKKSILDVLSRISASSFYFIGQGIGNEFYNNLNSNQDFIPLAV